MMRRQILVALAVCGLIVWSCAAGAVEPNEILKDPVLEGRARTISAELRCLVCQNQSIDDSSAALARDLRLIVRERLQAGDTDGQVRAYLVARYGDFVLLKPPFKRETLVLWGMPFGLVILGGVALWRRARGSEDIKTPPLDAEEEGRLAALLQEPRA